MFSGRINSKLEVFEYEGQGEDPVDLQLPLLVAIVAIEGQSLESMEDDNTFRRFGAIEEAHWRKEDSDNRLRVATCNKSFDSQQEILYPRDLGGNLHLNSLVHSSASIVGVSLPLFQSVRLYQALETYQYAQSSSKLKR